jgi:hypothetical protein
MRIGDRGIPPANKRDLSDDVAHLMAAGESLEEIARRLGIQPGSVARSLSRYGYHELARPFYALHKRLRQY